MLQPRRKPLHTTPFLHQQLAGWTPVHPKVQFPVTFGIYEEGQNLALYLTPASLETICAALDLPGEDQAVYLSDGPNGAGPRVVPWSTIHDLEGEVVHVSAHAVLGQEAVDALPVPLLADLGEALPLEFGSRAAVSVQDGCHAAVVARDTTLLASCLRAFLEDYVHCALGRDASLPVLAVADLAPLLDPLEPGAWYEAHFQAHRRYWTLDASLHGAEVDHQLRWVCEGEGGRWRAGWSWS